MVCGAMQDLPWHNIWSADNPVEVLNECLLLLVGHFVPTKSICMHNKDNEFAHLKMAISHVLVLMQISYPYIV